MTSLYKTLKAGVIHETIAKLDNDMDVGLTRFNELPSRTKPQTACEQGSLWLIERSLNFFKYTYTAMRMVVFRKIKVTYACMTAWNVR